MLKKNMYLWLCLIYFHAVACLAADNSTCGVPIVLGNESIEKEVAAEFERSSIEFSYVNGILCVDYGSSKPVEKILDIAISRFIDPRNSVSLYLPIQNIVKQILKEKSIMFREEVLQGVSYLVWHPEDSDQVEAIIKQEKENFIQSLQ